MLIKSIETANFRVTTTTNGNFEIKATQAMSKAYLRLKKIANPMPCGADVTTETVLKTVEALELATAKLAAI